MEPNTTPNEEAVRTQCEHLLFHKPSSQRLAVKSALSQSLSVVTGGAEPAAFFDGFREKDGPVQSVCGSVWRPRSIAYPIYST